MATQKPDQPKPGQGVSAHLSSTYGIEIAPGGKGDCPFCNHKGFSVRKDDSIGKCFRGECGKFITAGSLHEEYSGSVYEVLDRMRVDFHAELVNKKSFAWNYLVGDRRIHESVVTDLLELGAVPQNYGVEAAFAPAIAVLAARSKDLLAKIEDDEKQRQEAKKRSGRMPQKTKVETERERSAEKLREAQAELAAHAQLLKDRLATTVGWIAFFHTNISHQVRSIRLRKASSKEKKFASINLFKNNTRSGSSGGVFGHGLFRPFAGTRKATRNRIIIVEGEFNALQLHSLAANVSPGGHTENCILSVGSSTTVDHTAIASFVKNLREDAPDPPCVIQDHDASGDKMVAEIGKRLVINLVIPPKKGQDIDELIREFKSDYAGAAKAVRSLLLNPVRKTRPFEAVAMDVRICRKGGEGDDRAPFEKDADTRDIITTDMCSRGVFYRDAAQGYYFLLEERTLIALDDSDKELSCFLDRYGLNPSEKIFEFCHEALCIQALRHGTPTRVHRFCWFNRETFALYVFNHANSIYRITTDTIDLVDNGTDGVLFLRNKKNEKIELTETTDDFDSVFNDTVTSLINFDTESNLTIEDQRHLFNLWFISMFFGSLMPTRPIAAFIGQKGAGKSNSLRRVGTLLFGSNYEVKNLPSDEGSFDAITTNTHLAAFDNADSKVDWLPDRLAICATGGTVSKRQLYTTNTLADYPIDCWVGITSRTPQYMRDDVADRLLVFHVKRFDQGAFIAESELLAAVIRDRSRIMTAVFNRLQKIIIALHATADRRYRVNFRMADFATFAIRLADHEGGRREIEATFDKLMNDQAAATLDGDSLVELIDKWILTHPTKGAISAADLYSDLQQISKARGVELEWRSSRSMANRINNCAGQLRTLFDVKISKNHHLKQKLYEFSRLPEPKTDTSRPDAAPAAPAAPARIPPK